MLHTKEARFTFTPGCWYAAELIGDEFGQDLRSLSPIRVDRVTPMKAGSRCFELAFYHANYPESVRDKVYRLQTLERARHFLLALSTEHTPHRVLLFHDIDSDWLRRHFGITVPEGQVVHEWLDRNL